MPSQKVIDTVKATIPALVENGETLTQHFYKRMFARNPEVLAFFNPANQTSGKQQKALAAAIVAFAQNIDNLEALGAAVELIANKHASLMVKPEHYPIVGENLLASIKEVLGDAATVEVVAAWGAAYSMLADILIDREAAIYATNETKPGGWDGFRAFRITEKSVESSLVTSFYLAPVDGRALPNYMPGQYITVRVPTESGTTTMRNYSLSDRPRGDVFRISVKREHGEPNGLVSTYLHTVANTGDELEVGPPCGEFILPKLTEHDRPLVFLAGGIGVTPLYSMIAQALEEPSEHSAVFVHACLDEDVQAFKAALDKMADESPRMKLHHRYAKPLDALQNDCRCSQGLVDAALLEQLIENRDADYYICGPTGFMDAMIGVLKSWNVPEAHIHSESFGPG